MSTNIYLSIGAVLKAIIAALHVGCIYFGATCYRHMGVGEEMAKLAERGSVKPTIITSFIVLIFTIWSFYALSGAGVIRKLPLLRWVLLAVTLIYLLRGVLGVFLYTKPLGRTREF